MKNEVKVVGSCTELIPSMPSTHECDVVEIRLDADHAEPQLTHFLSRCELPLLLVARDINEGGIQPLSAQERINRVLPHLLHAQYIDVEMRNWSEMTPLLEAAKDKDCELIASYHDFEKTPSQEEINALYYEAKATGADIVKFAFMTHHLDDLKRCQTLLQEHPEARIAVMGMGAYAPVSRVLLAQCGSELNYGYLGDTPTAPGQWNAPLLKTAISSSTEIVA